MNSLSFVGKVQTFLKKDPSLLVVAGLAVLCLTPSCSRENKVSREIAEHYGKKDYYETVLLCKRALAGGVESGEVYYYYGMSLVNLDRDYEAFRRLEKLRILNPVLAARAASNLLSLARDDFAAGSRRRAGERFAEAAELDPAVDLGSMYYLVAELYYRKKDYHKTVRFYEKALVAKPDTAAAENAYMNMADAYAKLNEKSKAKDCYRKVLERFPRGSAAERARWNLADILLYEGARENEFGNYEETIRLMEELLSLTDNLNFIQNGRYLLGQAYEGMAEYGEAYKQYKAILDSDTGSSGGVVKKAEARLEEFKRAGIGHD